MTSLDLNQRIKIFETFINLRSNLMLAMSFIRFSFIDPTPRDQCDFGLLGIERGEAQINAHARSIAIIRIALLYQTLTCYCTLTQMRPQLKDDDLEVYLDQFDDRAAVLNGMRILRNKFFHIGKMSSWNNDRYMQIMQGEFTTRGGLLGVTESLANLLNAFVGKCARGELYLFPEDLYDVEFTRSLRRIVLLEGLLGSEPTVEGTVMGGRLPPDADGV